MGMPTATSSVALPLVLFLKFLSQARSDLTVDPLLDAWRIWFNT
jgi:hypothetical protein